MADADGEGAGGGGPDAFAGVAPGAVLGVEQALLDAQVGDGVGVAGAAFGEEATDVVFGGGVGAGGEADAVGAFEGVVGGEVAAGAVDEPLEDAWAFVADEFVGEVVDAPFVGDDFGEGDEADAAPEGEAVTPPANGAAPATAAPPQP